MFGSPLVESLRVRPVERFHVAPEHVQPDGDRTVEHSGLGELVRDLRALTKGTFVVCCPD